MEQGYGKYVLLAPWGPGTRRFLGTGWVLNTFCPFARPGTDVQWHLHHKVVPSAFHCPGKATQGDLSPDPLTAPGS